jgi:hypothetical protein
VGLGLIIGLLKAADVQNTAPIGATGPVDPNPLVHPLVWLGIVMVFTGLVLLLGISARLALHRRGIDEVDRSGEHRHMYEARLFKVH